MKKILLTLFFPALLTAQTEKINFTKKLIYMNSSGSELTNTNVYYSPEGILVEDLQRNTNTLVKSGIGTGISLDLDNNGSFISEYYGYRQVDSLPTYKFQKLQEKDQIAGYSCTYYRVSKKDSYYDNMKLCITEDTSIDMVSRFNNNEQDKIKGFPLIITGYNGSYILKSIRNYSNHISIDFKSELAKATEAKKYYEDLYGYNDISDSVAVAADSAYAYDYEEEYYNNYKSEYKKAYEVDGSNNLAVDNLEKDSSYWNEIPQYCKKINDLIPGFKDKELKKHTKNYIGQLCDMYVSFAGYYSVDSKATLDQIRYEENYFRNTKLDKKDKKLLDDFLNELD